MITPKDRFCKVLPPHYPEYQGIEFKIVTFGALSTSVRHPRTGGLLVLKNAHLTSDLSQRQRSQLEVQREQRFDIKPITRSKQPFTRR